MKIAQSTYAESEKTKGVAKLVAINAGLFKGHFQIEAKQFLYGAEQVQCHK